MHVAGAFEERRIQAAIMAGNSRLGIVLSKFLSFSLAITIFTVASVGLSSITAFLLAPETGVESVGTLLLQCIIYIFAQISFLSICFVVSMFVKKLGAAIGINFAVLFTLEMCEQLMANKPWGEIFIRYTAIGQTMLSLVDSSPENMMTSILVSTLGVLLTLGVTYIIFRKEELK